jgi:hypothetical protein
MLLLTVFTASSWMLLASGIDLTSYRWKNRLLLVFSPTLSDARFEAFDRNVSKARAEISDRDLIVFKILETGTSRLEDEPLTPETAEELRRRFDVEPGRFTVILIGKDGGVKMVSENRADLEEIFDRIDSMPMRKREMKNKGDRWGRSMYGHASDPLIEAERSVRDGIDLLSCLG